MNRISILQQILVASQKLLVLLQQKQAALTPHTVQTSDPILYTKAVASLNNHMTLDPNIKPEVGCAEAVSAVMALAGINDGSRGIAGTAALDAWLMASPLFTKRSVPGVGFIIVSPTGQGNGLVEGHTGIIAKFNLQYTNDWGILSNNSNNGFFQEVWSLSRWMSNYHVKGALPVNYYEYTPK